MPGIPRRQAPIPADRSTSTVAFRIPWSMKIRLEHYARLVQYDWQAAAIERWHQDLDQLDQQARQNLGAEAEVGTIPPTDPPQ